MSRYVNLSVVAPSPLVKEKLYGEEAIKRMQEHWERSLDIVLPDQPDLIVLPEACDRFPAQSLEEQFEYYRFRGNQMRDFFAKIATANNCCIAYSAKTMNNNTGYGLNSTEIIDQHGKTAGIYSKNHPTIGEMANGKILPGKDAPLIQCDFGTVACAICFDLNFNELRLKYVKSKPDIILFSSMYHGGIMQNYWAYSCRSYFAAAVAGSHDSSIISPVGDIIASTNNYRYFTTARINFDRKVLHIDYNKDKLQPLKIKYGRKVKIHCPEHLGSVLLTSETDEFTTDDLVKEFELELLDDYFERSLEVQKNSLSNKN